MTDCCALIALSLFGANHHALRHRRSAGRHGLGHFFHVHQAHAAVGRDAELLVVTEMRNVGTGLVGGMHDHAALGHFHLLAVEFDFNHVEPFAGPPQGRQAPPRGAAND